MSVDPRAFIQTHQGDTVVRTASRREDGEAAVWVKPGELDGDGEVRLPVADIGGALSVLGFGMDDLFPPQ